MKSLFVLGRQPKLGLAELESVLGASNIQPLSDAFATSGLEAADIPFARLGGSVKVCSIIEHLDTQKWSGIESSLLRIAKKLGEGKDSKITTGISVYELPVHEKDIFATGLRLKKILKSSSGQSVRLVPLQNASLALSSAQVLHNKLNGEDGIEFVIVKSGSGAIIARTFAEQDINAYAKRDQNRPKRDARVGMLPPKLAQIIVNLAVGNADKKLTVLDPFCGTGVVLQEAGLMGFNLYGSDISDKMIDYTSANLQWLNETHKLTPISAMLQVGDATKHTWDEKIDAVACEGYLGQPFNNFPSADKLHEVMQTCNLIAKEFLKNIASQIPGGTRLCIALPAWHRPNGSFEHLKLLDQIDDLGYNLVDLKHVRAEELLYYRPDQVVARELLVITRK